MLQSLSLHMVQVWVFCKKQLLRRWLSKALLCPPGCGNWGIPGRKCFWVLSADTETWRWARREGWRGGLAESAPGGQVPGDSVCIYLLNDSHLSSLPLSPLISLSDIRCLSRLDVAFHSSDGTRQSYVRRNGNSERSSSRPLAGRYQCPSDVACCPRAASSTAHTNPLSLSLLVVYIPNILKIFAHLTGKNETLFVGLICICIDFSLLTGPEVFPVLG